MTLAAPLAPPAAAEPVAVPSGQPVELIEMRWDAPVEGALWLRLRFLAPQIGTEFSFAQVESDFAHLCRTVGLPLIDREGRAVELIIVSLSDRPLPFGQTDPKAVQFFESFRPRDETCLWEPF